MTFLVSLLPKSCWSWPQSLHQGGSCDDLCVDELRPNGWRLNATDCQHNGPHSSGEFMSKIQFCFVKNNIFILHVNESFRMECLQGIYVFSFYSITSHKLQAGKKIFLTILLLFIIGMYIITAEVNLWPIDFLTLNAKWKRKLSLKDLEAITQNIGWLGATMSFAYCSAPLASIQEVAILLTLFRPTLCCCLSIF